MDCDNVRLLLVELQEGIISAEDKALVEQHVATCVRCTADLKSIGETLGGLREVRTGNVPTHYFTNLLPRIHQRLEKRRSLSTVFTVPSWVQRLLAPVSAFGVVATIVVLYGLLGPAEESAEMYLKRIVSQLPKEDIEGMVESTTYSPIMTKALEPAQRLSESLSNFPQVSRRIERELADDEVLHGHRMTIILAADNSFEDINDDEVEFIIDKLKATNL